MLEDTKEVDSDNNVHSILSFMLLLLLIYDDRYVIDILGRMMDVFLVGRMGSGTIHM